MTMASDLNVGNVLVIGRDALGFTIEAKISRIVPHYNNGNPMLEIHTVELAWPLYIPENSGVEVRR